MKLLTFLLSVGFVAYLLAAGLDNGALYSAVDIQPGSQHAHDFAAGIWTAFIPGIGLLWILSNFVKWWD